MTGGREFEGGEGVSSPQCSDVLLVYALGLKRDFYFPLACRLVEFICFPLFWCSALNFLRASQRVKFASFPTRKNQILVLGFTSSKKKKLLAGAGRTVLQKCLCVRPEEDMQGPECFSFRMVSSLLLYEAVKTNMSAMKILLLKFKNRADILGIQSASERVGFGLWKLRLLR